MRDVHTLSEVEALLRAQFPAWHPASETLALEHCLGRVLATDIAAPLDVPGFDRSTMDGYAVQARDTFGASASMPAMLRLIGEVQMGAEPDFAIEQGECAAISTGGRLPMGADSVAMIEYTSQMDGGTVLIESPLSPGKHIAFRGDDVKSGNIVLERGLRLRPQDLGTLAALGMDSAPVFVRPRVGIISTGDELVQAGKPLGGAQVYDINSHALAAAVTEAGGHVMNIGVVRDDWDALSTTVENALCECDMLLISGGSSVGTLDMTRKLIDSAGEPGVFVHGVAVKPGRPTIIGNVCGKPVFGLPGHPVSAYLIFLLLVRPLLLAMGGAADIAARGAAAILTDKLPSAGGREEFAPVSLRYDDDELFATPLWYKSGLISTLSRADGFAHIPRNREGYDKGDIVRIYYM